MERTAFLRTRAVGSPSKSDDNPDISAHSVSCSAAYCAHLFLVCEPKPAPVDVVAQGWSAYPLLLCVIADMPRRLLWYLRKKLS